MEHIRKIVLALRHTIIITSSTSTLHQSFAIHTPLTTAMKFTLSTFALAFAALTNAQYYVNQSAPFHLVLISDDDAVNGSTLSACHTGAAIESLCLSNGNSTSSPTPIPAATFYFNTSAIPQPASPGSTPGILGYTLQATPPIPSSVEFVYDPIVNYALPQLYPGDGGQTLAFDEQDLLNVQGYVNYSVSPPKAGDWVAYYRWFSCTTYYAGYEYVNLVFALGDTTPQTPGCAKVDVKRVFI
jgi:hypothetical protein